MDDSRRRLRGNIAAAIVAIAVGYASSAAAQGGGGERAYCNITAIETKRLANAVQIVIRADGLMDPDIQQSYFFNQDAARMGRWDKVGKRVSDIPILIRNARSQVGSIANVGVYPVSHVEVTVPPEAHEGIGVQVRVVLYRAGMTSEVRLGSDRWSMGLEGEKPPIIAMEQSQDRRSILITVTSDRRTPQPPQPRATADPAKTVLQVGAHEGIVTVYAVNADLKDIARELAQATGISITVAGALQRKVSMALDSVCVDEVLHCMALTCGGSLSKTAQGYYLADAVIREASAYYGSSFAEIPLRYVTADAARDSLPDVLLDHVQMDPQRNVLTVAGSADLIEKVRRDVEVLDKPVPMVEVTTTAAEFQSATDLSKAFGAALQWTGGTAVLDDWGDLTYSSMSVGPDDLMLTLRAMESNGRVRIRSRGTTVVLNGRTARLFAGQSKQMTAQYFDFWYGTVETRILTVRSGTSVEVTPWTDGRGTVIATVHSEVSDVTDKDKATGNPTISQRMAETTVRLSDGQTLFIGGLEMAEQTSSQRSLLAGRLLYPRVRSERDSRLAVFVTTRVVRGSATRNSDALEQEQ